MSICLLLMTDGRDSLLMQTIASAIENLKGPITRQVIHTDAGYTHMETLRYMCPDWEVIGGERLGFGGAINRAWEHLKDEEWLVHLEDDFTFNRPVPLNAMKKVLAVNSHLAQMCLRRQPWNEAEKKAGGVIEQWPNLYSDEELDGYKWLEHRLFFSTNPSLLPKWVRQAGWPVVPQSESIFSEALFAASPQIKSAFWGARETTPWVTHIGEKRVGTSY